MHSDGDVSDEARGRTEIGKIFAGKWKLESLLGTGGTSAVYAASDPDGRQVALKILRPELASKKAKARLLREADVANQLAADGAVAVLEGGVDGDDLFLVMELLDGSTLGARAAAAGGKLGVEEVARLATGLLRVLAAAHARGIIHRDIKPENVFLTRAGEVRVLDFGLAHLDDPNAASSVLTKSGATMGTPTFMAPEQARGRAREVDARTDVWGAAATLFTLLSGRPVHAAETIGEALVMAGSLPAPPLALHAPEVPRPFAVVIDRALSFRPDDRYPDAGAMLAALEQARESLTQGESALSEQLAATLPDDGAASSPQTVGTRAVVPTDARGRRQRWLTMGLGLALVATIVAIAIRGNIQSHAASVAPDGAEPAITAAPKSAPAEVPVSPLHYAVTLPVIPPALSADERPVRIDRPVPPPVTAGHRSIRRPSTTSSEPTAAATSAPAPSTAAPIAPAASAAPSAAAPASAPASIPTASRGGGPLDEILDHRK